MKFSKRNICIVGFNDSFKELAKIAFLDHDIGRFKQARFLSSYDDSKLSLQKLVSDNNKNNPLEQMTKIEEINDTISLIRKVLSPKEEEVFNLLINDLSYKQIAIILNSNPKSIDNAIQRIKAKVRKVINKEEN